LSFCCLSMSPAVHTSAPYNRPGAIASFPGGLPLVVMPGVPFGSYLGGLFDSRSVFWLMAILGVITFIGIIFVAPNIKSDEAPQLKKELRMFKNKNVLFVIAIIVFGFSGVFTAYTFMNPMIRTFY